MSSNDKTKKYWQIYYAKNKEKIKARIKVARPQISAILGLWAAVEGGDLLFQSITTCT
jgi:hypothetical protein